MTAQRVMSVGYTFREGFPVRKMDADAIGQALEALTHDDDTLSLDALVNVARDPASPLFAALTTDLDAMAAKLHLLEVRDVIGALHYREVDMATEEERIGGRVFQPTGTANQVRKIRYTPLPYQPPEPRRMVVTQRTDPPATSTVAAPLNYLKAATREIRPLPRATEAAVGGVTPVLTREKAVELLQTWAKRLETDPYFDEVVAAIQRLD